MHYTKSIGLCLLGVFFISNTHSEVLSWRANVDQQYETRVTLNESVASINSITAKPEIILNKSLNQEVAAKNESTIPYISRLPSFPKTDITPGSVWTQKAVVTYDLSSFGYPEPVTVEVPVTYTFIDIAEIDARSYPHIKAEWFPVYIPATSLAKRTGIIRLSGASSMEIYWDNKSGSPKRSSLTEEVQYLFNTNASLLLKKETAEIFKTVTDIQREKDVSDLNKLISSQQVANVEIKQSNEGIVLSIENIQFDAESAKMADSEKAKLTKVGTLLSSLKNRKLKIIGHSANPAGSDEEELLTLSTLRAQAVADFLVESGIKTEDAVIAVGMGGSKPIASNETTEGRSKNRRVEILIIDEENKE